MHSYLKDTLTLRTGTIRPRMSNLSPADYKKMSSKTYKQKKEKLYIVTDVIGNDLGVFDQDKLVAFFNISYGSLKRYIDKNKRVNAFYYINKQKDEESNSSSNS